jgi:hypothetical protein
MLHCSLLFSAAVALYHLQDVYIQNLESVFQCFSMAQWGGEFLKGKRKCKN